MSQFDKMMTRHQVDWRKSGCSVRGNGSQNGREYAHILPSRDWRHGFWPGAIDKLDAYLADNRVQRHTGVHNLKSSWTLCANLYFPFGSTPEGLGLLAGFFRHAVDPRIETVEVLELEYSEEGALAPGPLLGELGGSRGSGQDVAGSRSLREQWSGTPVDRKQVRRAFFLCLLRSARQRQCRASRKSRARTLPERRESGRRSCRPVSASALGTQILGNPGSGDRFQRVGALNCCPAAFGGYQLFRQQALAEGIASSGKYDLVISCVAYDERNSTLQRSLRTTGLEKFEDWADCFAEKRFSSRFHINNGSHGSPETVGNSGSLGSNMSKRATGWSLR